MQRAGPSYSLLLLALAGLILATALPAGAAYTKLYKCKNTTTITQSHLRVTNNAMEVVTGYTANPTQLSPPAITSCLLSGVYCTRLRYGQPTVPVVPVGGYGTIGWRTADNSCRLADLQWVSPTGVLTRVTTAAQLEGVPGGGEVWYDSVNKRFVWLLINDTDAPIELSDVSFEVLETEPPIDWVAPMSASGMMRPMQLGEGLPHHDVVSLRVNGFLERYVTPLREQVSDAVGAGHLLAEDAATLTGHLDDAEEALTAGLAAYDPADTAAAEAQWDAAVSALTAFKALVREFAGLPAETAAAPSIPSPFAPQPAQVRLASVAHRLWDPLFVSLTYGRPLSWMPAGGGRS